MTERAETIVQFGEGDFLPGLVGLLVHQANAAGAEVGQIVAVHSEETERVRHLRSHDGRYHVDIRGLDTSRIVDETVEVDSLSRVLVAGQEWEEIADLACSEELRFVVSDTTPAERTLLPEDDDRESNSPRSFPAQLTELLNLRHENGLPGLTMLPCEPVASNADALLALIMAQAARWGWEGRFTYWLETECRWLNTLADRIIQPMPTDPSGFTVEPFALWVIEGSRGEPPVFTHPAIGRSLHLNRYRLRKERLFDAVQHDLAVRTHGLPFTTVWAAATDPLLAVWLRERLFIEILPSLENQIDNAEAYANHTLERLANPLLERCLSDLLSAADG